MDSIKLTINNSVIELIEADITGLDTDAIVNAANAQLVLGGGVAGAIKRKGGEQIQKECDAIGGTVVGGAVITGAGDLNAKHIIHAVGPSVIKGEDGDKLKQATINSLKLADENDIKSIALPAISTGIFGFPMKECARIMLKAAIEYLQGQTRIEKVIFCLYDQKALETFIKQLKLLQK